MSQQGLLYLPPPPIPSDFMRQFKQIVPVCPTGERYLRWVWGMDRKQLNRNHCRYHDALNVPAKYVGLERWVLEVWQTPAVFDEAEWAMHEKTLGPFPAQGVWDFVSILETATGEFLNLGQRALQMSREWRHWRGQDKKVVIDDLMETMRRSDELQERNWEERKNAILDDFVTEYLKATPGTRVSNIGNIGKRTESGLILPPGLKN